MAEGRELTLAEVLAIIQRAGDLAAKIVLIGGQATAFWAARFEDAELRNLGPVTSKDLDFCGLPAQVREFAARVGGTYRLRLPQMRASLARRAQPSSAR